MGGKKGTWKDRTKPTPNTTQSKPKTRKQR